MTSSQLTIASLATSTPMGAQAYTAQIIAHAPDALNVATGEQWRVRTLAFRSMRSSLPGQRRLPMGRIARASASTRRLWGRTLYGGDTVTHRMELELPPSPHADVITLHDVVAWRFADESPPVPAAIEEARRAAAVICVSHFSAREAVELLGLDAPHVVHNGVDERYFHAVPLTEPERTSLALNGPYVLHAGGAAQRKNLAALAEAWPLVHRERPHLTLALAGPPHPRRTALFEGMPGVRLLGRLADELMPGLVAAADAVVVPSLYEGFGLPALEAMVAGVPVVVANTSSLPEVVGDTGIIVEPTATAIAAGLIDATSHDTHVTTLLRRARQRAESFTWQRSAEGHARVWASVR